MNCVIKNIYDIIYFLLFKKKKKLISFTDLILQNHRTWTREAVNERITMDL